MKAALLFLLVLSSCALDFKSTTEPRNFYKKQGLKHTEYNLDSFSRVNVVVLGDSAYIRVTHFRFGLIMEAKTDTSQIKIVW